MRWHSAATYALFFPILAFIILIFTPESPTYLIKSGNPDKAKKTILKLYGPDFDVDEELRQIKSGLEKPNNDDNVNDKIKKKAMYQRPEVVKPFLIIMALSVVQQFSGMSIMRAYVVKIFNEVFQENDPDQFSKLQDEEFCDESEKTASEAYLAAIFVGIMRLLSSLLSSKLLYHYRRRPMYLISGKILKSLIFKNKYLFFYFLATFTSIALFSFATCNFLLSKLNFEVSSETVEAAIKWTSLASACLLVFSVQLGT